MTLSTGLEQAIQAGLAAMQRDPGLHLDRPFRQAIYAALGPRVDYSFPGGGAGHIRRTHLDRLASQHVLPIWDTVWPSVHLPREILALADQALFASQAERDTARRELGYYVSEADDFEQADQNQHPFEGGVLRAAIKTLSRAVSEVSFDPTHPDLATRDQQTDYNDWDTAFYAAAASSLSVPWRSDAAGNARRRAFWEWWLREAVPAAWESVPEGGR